MYRIMLAIDGSDHSQKVIDEALIIAEALKAEVTIINVSWGSVMSPGVSIHLSDEELDRIAKNIKQDSEEIVEKAAKQFRDKGLTAKTKVIYDRKAPSDAICAMVEDNEFNLVVLGSHGLRGIREAFLGSVSNKVAHCAKTNVLIVK